MAQKRDDLYPRNKRAFEAYVNQKQAIDAIRRSGALVRQARDQIASVLQPLNQEIGAREQSYRQNGVALLVDSAHKVLPTAIALLLGIMVTPVAIKAFFYFLIAPIASRRAAITLLPDVCGDIEGVTDCMTSDADRLKASAVSQPITIHANQEL